MTGENSDRSDRTANALVIAAFALLAAGYVTASLQNPVSRDLKIHRIDRPGEIQKQAIPLFPGAPQP